jgi:hypothetical protein
MIRNISPRENCETLFAAFVLSGNKRSKIKTELSSALIIIYFILTFAKPVCLKTTIIPRKT